ncbi:MAG: hypothetical protein MH825_02060 [Cyanobacteria bacterium]|nr:hypothetical protein [Cyanobacteriota bacterium]
MSPASDPSSSASNPSVPQRPVPPKPPKPPVIREVIPKKAATPPAPAAATATPATDDRAATPRPMPGRPKPSRPMPKRLPEVTHLPSTAEALALGAQTLPGVTADACPVPPPSEPMQYRAIGLVRGRYVPSEEQFTQGKVLAADGTEIDAVLLGRVMSLIRNHVDLEVDHLWVAYPRTRTEDLHVQIVGIWEPETLKRGGADRAAATEAVAEVEAEPEVKGAEDPSPSAPGVADPEAVTPADEKADGSPDEAIADQADGKADATTDATVEDKAGEGTGATTDDGADGNAQAAPAIAPLQSIGENQFSIRGAVVHQSQEESCVTVKIRQTPRSEKQKAKAFKIRLEGQLSERPTGYFWDLVAERRGNQLALVAATAIAPLPPQKRKPFQKGGPKGKPRSQDERGDRGPREDRPRTGNRSNRPERSERPERTGNRPPRKP